MDSYKNIKYKEIFDDKVKSFLDNDEIQKDIEEYIEKYNELLDNSLYFKKGIFNHSQAEDIAKQLQKNGFFKAQHSVLFGEQKLSTEKELTAVINQEKEKILKDTTLQETFNKLDGKITKNESLKQFRKVLSENNFIIAELKNLESFEAKLWKYYIKENLSNFNELLNVYSESKEKIIEISDKAKLEKNKWFKVMEIFNKRFTVPFKVTISNEVNVMLKCKVPSIAFEFVEQKNRKNIKKEDLFEVLSQGEKRALYLLDIIFEIEARKEEEGQHLFIIDDIADSFDYKNKYAIIEYLRDISQVDNFYQIILSHNFDFHRTVSSRLSINRNNKLNVLKLSNNDIELKTEYYQNNPFNNWRGRLNNEFCLIASIPFVRNLAEYIGDKDSNKALTKFLHIKDETVNLTRKDLKDIFKKILKNDTTNEKFGDDKFLCFLKESAKNIPDSKDIKLEHKIVLAISIRLTAEKFMIDEIKDTNYVNKIKKNQTAKLLDRYKVLFPNEKKNIEILDKVQLMTPENIHLNSFMYEPLLDMSSEYLITLNKDLKSINC